MEKHRPGPYVQGDCDAEFTPERRTPEWCVEATIPDGGRTCKDRAAAPRVRGDGGRITDAGGLVVVRRLWDALGLGRLDRRPGAGGPRPLPAVADGRVVGGAAPVRRRGDGRPAASGAAGRAPHLRLGAGAAPGHVRALAAVLGRGDVPPARRSAVADGAAALGAGRRGAPVGDDRDGLDGRGALRAEAGGGGAGLQPEEAGPSLAPPPAGLRPGDGRLPRGALAAGQRAHGPGGGGVAGRAGGPPEGGGGAADRRAAGQGVLLEVHRRGAWRRSACPTCSRCRGTPGSAASGAPGRPPPADGAGGPGAEDRLRRAVGGRGFSRSRGGDGSAPWRGSSISRRGRPR